MFARMHLMMACLTAGAVLFNSGCQTPSGSETGSRQPQQTPTGAKEATPAETPVDLPPARIEARTFLAAARLHESQNRPLQAVQQYQYALAEDPANAQILNRIGMLYDQLGNSAAAEQAYEQALLHEPDSALLHNNLAFSYILRQRWQEAEIELTRAIELAPEFARARTNLGLVLAQTGRFDDALRQFYMVLPPDEALYNVGLMYQSKRKDVEAAEAYKRALQANPKLIAAQEQLKRMPSDVLGAADRKLQEEREAAGRLAAAETPPAPEARENPTTQPAWSISELPTVPLACDRWPDDYLLGMMADAIDWIPGSVREITADIKEIAASIQDNVPATQPADAQIQTTERPPAFDPTVAAELDALFPSWQRSPEMIDDLQAFSLVSLGDDTTDWLDWQASPQAVSVDEPVPATDGEPLSESEIPN